MNNYEYIRNYNDSDADARFMNQINKLAETFDPDTELVSEKYNAALEKYMMETPELLPGAFENFKFVEQKCDELARARKARIHSSISLMYYTAIIELRMPMLIFGKPDYELFDAIRDRIQYVTVKPTARELHVSIVIPYFADDESPFERALDEAFGDGQTK